MNNIKLVLDMIDYNHFIEDDVLFYLLISINDSIRWFMTLFSKIFNCLVLEICFWKQLKLSIVGVLVLSNLLMVPHKDVIFIVALSKDALALLFYFG